MMGFLQRLKAILPFGIQGKGKRNYAAAANGRLLASWAFVSQSIDTILRADLPTLRSRSRGLIRNNPFAAKFQKLIVTNVVGPQGILLQNKAKNEDGSLDSAANNIIEQKFREWSQPQNCTVTGKLSFVEVQRIVAQSVSSDGEIFIRKVRDYPNSFRFAIQLLEADFIDHNMTKTLPNGNEIKMGIEYDTWRRPVAYYVLSMHPGDIGTAAGQKTVRIPASEVLHIYRPFSVDQGRGVPWLAPSMIRMNHLDGYEEAELVASRMHAAKSVAIETPAGDDPASMTDGTDSSGNTLVDYGEPGGVYRLADGEKATLLDPSHPAGNFDPFMKAMLRSIATGIGVSYHSLAGDLSDVNYSSIRAGSLDERDQWRILQSWLIDSLCRPIFEEVLEATLLTQSRLPVTKFDKFNAPKFNLRGWQWVDPLKDVQANVIALKNGLTTYTRVVAETLGMDLEEVLEQRQWERELMEQYGFDFDNAKATVGSVLTDATQQPQEAAA